MSERLNYDRLYQEALSDPELKRTQVELEAALSNSREARQVVFDLFQDLEGFSLDDYKSFADVSLSLDRLARFFAAAVADRRRYPAGLDPRITIMSQLILDVPDETLLSLHLSEATAAAEIRLAAAMKLYELGRLSSGGAARLAGIPRTVFLSRLTDYGIDTFMLGENELAEQTPLG